MTDPRNATIELVDSHHGIYAAHELACRYPLFGESGVEQDREALKAQFHPDNPENCENIEYLFPRLFVKELESGALWRIEWHEGDIIAVHPEAQWNEEIDGYEFACNECKKGGSKV